MKEDYSEDNIRDIIDDTKEEFNLNDQIKLFTAKIGTYIGFALFTLITYFISDQYIPAEEMTILSVLLAVFLASAGIGGSYVFFFNKNKLYMEDKTVTIGVLAKSLKKIDELVISNTKLEVEINNLIAQNLNIHETLIGYSIVIKDFENYLYKIASEKALVNKFIETIDKERVKDGAT